MNLSRSIMLFSVVVFYVQIDQSSVLFLHSSFLQEIPLLFGEMKVSLKTSVIYLNISPNKF